MLCAYPSPPITYLHFLPAQGHALDARDARRRDADSSRDSRETGGRADMGGGGGVVRCDVGGVVRCVDQLGNVLLEGLGRFWSSAERCGGVEGVAVGGMSGGSGCGGAVGGRVVWS